MSYQPRERFRTTTFVSILAACFLSSLLSQTTVAMECRDLEKAGVIPDVLPASACHELSVQVDIEFPSGSPTRGSPMPLRAVTECPKIILSRKPEKGQKFVVFLTDPDAPSRLNPVAAEWAHWVASTEGTTIQSNSKTFLPYAPPTPPKGTGAHRYVALLYLGDTSRLSGVPSASKRKQWGGRRHAHAVASENGLQLVGVEWFTVEHK
ncbi:phosphatidylethanolamine-binding protein [Toxoplasma gondii RUB]|uniref:Phosphatidylethanolamine-binding protein n=2 Tax=Toxoplasma gondii TaxID=5811 RepID=A0A086LVG9_TOXGO|nr:phosphatidylethanolamine-binding protein [Toxoplasma gondii RUB]PUA88315.1 phosphatidylethanolamine-binding protein [Toxoplasma gondii TgCATBr9]